MRGERGRSLAIVRGEGWVAVGREKKRGGKQERKGKKRAMHINFKLMYHSC